MTPTEQVRAAGCDALVSPSIVHTVNDEGGIVYRCRCIVCARCGHHTGNANQGHYWAWCKVEQRMRDFHFCCPDDCELPEPRDPFA
jgi:hypothetical protein